MKKTQRETNPFPYTDSNKRYYTYDYFLRHTYGGKVAKITLDAGMTCPNIDGTCGVGGCIYCSARGSGDFAESPLLPIDRQYAIQCERMRKKWDTLRFIPYLQAHTNTYAPIERLRRIYDEARSLPGAVGMSIATRADVLSPEVLSLLAECAEQTDLTVELGLQTIHDQTAELIRRGHDFKTFCKGYYALRDASPSIRIGIHLINGLPGEDRDMMLESARTVGELMPDELKIHLLYVLKDTELARLYLAGAYTPLSLDAFVTTVAEQLTYLPQSTVIGRLTGDGAPDELLAPLWSLKKLVVLNTIDRCLYERGWYQGCNRT